MTATGRISVSSRQAPRGAVLLEVVVAVAILLMAAITITGAVSQSFRVMERSRLELRAADLARSAMAEIEAGIATPEALNGPVHEEPLAVVDEEGKGAGSGVNAPGGDALRRETGWELEIVVTPSPFRSLSKVSISAICRPPGGGEAALASYTLHQLVKLSADAEDRAGQTGDLVTESERGRRSQERSGPTPAFGDEEGGP